MENPRATARVRNLLQERFHLKTREESKELSIYLLKVAKGGHKMKATPNDIPYGGTMQGTDLNMRGAPIDLLTATIEFTAGQHVFNDTGLTGRYDIKLHWRDERIGGEGPSIFVALREQLGLQLDSKKGPVTILTIEHLERPTEN